VLLPIERAVAMIRSSDPGDMPCHSVGNHAHAAFWAELCALGLAELCATLRLAQKDPL